VRHKAGISYQIQPHRPRLFASLLGPIESLPTRTSPALQDANAIRRLPETRGWYIPSNRVPSIVAVCVMSHISIELRPIASPPARRSSSVYARRRCSKASTRAARLVYPINCRANYRHSLSHSHIEVFRKTRMYGIFTSSHSFSSEVHRDFWLLLV